MACRWLAGWLLCAVACKNCAMLLWKTVCALAVGGRLTGCCTAHVAADAPSCTRIVLALSDLLSYKNCNQPRTKPSSHRTHSDENPTQKLGQTASHQNPSKTASHQNPRARHLPVCSHVQTKITKRRGTKNPALQSMCPSSKINPGPPVHAKLGCVQDPVRRDRAQHPMQGLIRFFTFPHTVCCAHKTPRPFNQNIRQPHSVTAWERRRPITAPLQVTSQARRPGSKPTQRPCKAL